VGTWRTGPTYGARKVSVYGPSRLGRIARMLRFRRRKRFLPTEPLDEMPPDIGVREPRRPRPLGGAGAVTLDPPQ